MQTIQAGSVGDMRLAAEAPKVAVKAQPAEIRIKTKPDPIELAKLEKTLAQHNISLKFSKDETTNHIVVQMIDQHGEAIRQFPTEVSLSLAATFQKMQGVFLSVDK